MSKAFVKNEDSEQDDEGADFIAPELPPGTKNYITPSGAARLRDEIVRLSEVERPELLKTVDSKSRLRKLDRRIRFLTDRLESAVIVDTAAQKAEKILFGATVTVADEKGDRRTYQIVGIDETNAQEGRISWLSPIGKALLQNEVGDVVTVTTPRGEEQLEVVGVEYRV